MPVVDHARLIVWQRPDVWTLVSSSCFLPHSLLFTTVQTQLESGYSVPHMKISKFSNIQYENFY